MREIDKILDQNERVLWEGTPVFWPFFVGNSILLTVFGFFWMMFILVFIVSMGPIVLLFPHFWVGILLLIGPGLYHFLVYKHTYYALTSRRVLIQKGVIGRDFQIIDFDQITNAEVNVGIFDQFFGKNTGTVLISTPTSFVTSNSGQRAAPYRLCNIVNPYEVFKFFKKVSYDVKTDIEFPNEYRPAENPGYKTEYKS
ncbi:MAG: PH domain-containing protein [Deltaproteobacteria bacterium]|nr:PH domain-containing protein [Deltaproteobacteria bacterium]